MANIIQHGMRWLGGKMKDHATQFVTVIPANDTAAAMTVLATIAPSQKLLSDGTVATSAEDVDFAITARDLMVDGETYVPQMGDTIEAVINSYRRRFSVQTDGLRDADNWTDSSRTRRLIHTTDKGEQ